MREFFEVNKRRAHVVLAMLSIVVAILLLRAAILTVGSANRLQADLVVMNRSPQSFIALGLQVDELQKITSNIDNYKLSEIKGALVKTAHLAGYARTEFQAQYQAWLSVKDEMSKDKESFIQLRGRLDEVQRLQGQEVVRLKKLLDEATKPSIFDDFVSFF